MLKKILIFVPLVIVALVAAVLIAAAFQPDSFSMERSAVLDATPEALFEQVNDHRNFVKWNPFNELDPDVKNTFSGADFGVGAVCSWRGDRNIGEGSSTITESIPYELVRQRMEWISPMEGTSTVDFTFEPVGEKTRVTWKMYGSQNFAGKAMSLFMDMEKMCGPMFEQGLKSLEKAAKESNPPNP